MDKIGKIIDINVDLQQNGKLSCLNLLWGSSVCLLLRFKIDKKFFNISGYTARFSFSSAIDDLENLREFNSIITDTENNCIIVKIDRTELLIDDVDDWVYAITLVSGTKNYLMGMGELNIKKYFIQEFTSSSTSSTSSSSSSSSTSLSSESSSSSSSTSSSSSSSSSSSTSLSSESSSSSSTSLSSESSSSSSTSLSSEISSSSSEISSSSSEISSSSSSSYEEILGIGTMVIGSTFKVA